MVAELHSALHRPLQESASTRPVRQACPAQRPRTNAPIPITRFRSSVKNSTLPPRGSLHQGKQHSRCRGPVRQLGPRRTRRRRTPMPSSRERPWSSSSRLSQLKRSCGRTGRAGPNAALVTMPRAPIALSNWTIGRVSPGDRHTTTRWRSESGTVSRLLGVPFTARYTGRCGRACGTRRGGTSAWSMRRLWMGPDMAGSHPPRGALVGRCRSLRAAGGDVFAGTETGAPGPATSGRARRPKRGADCALNSLVAGVAEFLPCSFSKPATWGCRVRLQSQDAGPSRVHGGDTNLD